MFLLTNSAQPVAPVSFLNSLSALILSPIFGVKTHNYTDQSESAHYVFEWIEDGLRGQMTAYGKGIKQQDFIILSSGRYQVEEIEYYSNPSHLWTAVLTKVLE
jgi:hypothetical protein